MITLYADYGKIYEVDQGSFPDGTLHLSLPDDYINAVEWRYENDAELFALICIRRHYSDCDMNLILPYVPHARMDRVKDPTDVFTLKYFCEVINLLNFNEVWVLDVHSNVSLALLDRVSPIPIEQTLNECMKRVNRDDIVLFFPDEGAMKRYSGIFDKPYAFGIKKRNWQTGKIEGLQIVNEEFVKDKPVLIIDDICSYGGTFLHSARALKAAGAGDIYLYITHAENSMLKGEMYNTPDLVTKIYTVETIFGGEDPLGKIDIIQTW